MPLKRKHQIFIFGVFIFFVDIIFSLGGDIVFEKYADVVGVEQMCEMLNICKTQAYVLLREGLIKSKRIGRIYKIPKIYIVQYLESDYN